MRTNSGFKRKHKSIQHWRWAVLNSIVSTNPRLKQKSENNAALKQTKDSHLQQTAKIGSDTFTWPPHPPAPQQANKNNNNSSWTEKEIYLQSLDLNTWSFDLILCMSKWCLSVKACPGCNQHFKCNREKWPQSLPHMHRCHSWPGNGTWNTQVQKMCCWWRMKHYDAGTCSQSRHEAKHFFTTSLATTKKRK